MTAEDIKRVVAEVERRWRERTPATRIDEVDASYRVSRGEMRRWCNEQNIPYDDMDEMLDVELVRLFMKLRGEFPDEKWNHMNFKARETCKKHGIKIPRAKKKKD